jgi:hypothetical protein
MTGGGYIAFKSYADNLVPDDTNVSVNYWEGEDIFLAKNPFSAYRPDGGVGKNRSSSRSSLSLKNPSGKAHKFYLTAENKGNVFDDLCIKGDSGGAKYRTSYRQIGGGNVTGDVLRGKLVSGQIPGEKAVLQCIAKPKGKSQRKATLTHRVKSSGARSKQDVARAKVENDAPKKEPVSVKPTSLF